MYIKFQNSSKIQPTNCYRLCITFLYESINDGDLEKKYFFVVRNSKKSPDQETGSGNRVYLKVLNDAKLVLNEHKLLPYSFRSLGRPLFPKPASWLGVFLRLLTAR